MASELATENQRRAGLEAELEDVRQSMATIETKLKARIEEVKQLVSQLGEATEESAALKGRLAQSEANLEAAHATRKSLEKELEGRVVPPPSNPDDAALQELLAEQEQQAAEARNRIEQLEVALEARTRELSESGTRLASVQAILAERDVQLAELREQGHASGTSQGDQTSRNVSSGEEVAELKESLREQERRAASWEEKVQEIEAELLATTRSHEEVQRELERLREAAATGGGDESLSIELEIMTRERNELAAELAVLKAEKGS